MIYNSIMKDIIYEIKNKLTMADILEHYGIEIRRNKALCPFHNDRNPSMHVYANNYHCFTCGAHGDQIAFVQEYFNLDFQSSCRKIGFDFGLNLPLDRPMTVREYYQAKEAEEKHRKEKEERDKIEQEYIRAYDEYARLDVQKIRYKPRSAEEVPDRRFLEALSGLETARYNLDMAEARLMQGNGTK